MNLTTAEFLSAIFEYPDLPEGEQVCLTHPDSFVDYLGNTVDFFRNYPVNARLLRSIERRRDLSWYFCVSTCQPADHGDRFNRRRESLVAAYCIVLDDIGTKALTPPVEPSWKLYSSEGNAQWGYLLEPVDVSLGSEGLTYYEGCVRGLARAGYSDPGAQGAYRVMRIPGSKHKSGYFAELYDWHPERVWQLEDLMAELEVEPVAQRTRYASREAIPLVALGDVQDPVLAWLAERGLVFGHTDRWVHIRCPWHEQHTSGTDGDGSTSYCPVGYGGTRGASFSCLHGHCEARGSRDFMDWVAQQGGPRLDTQTRPVMPAALQKLWENN